MGFHATFTVTLYPPIRAISARPHHPLSLRTLWVPHQPRGPPLHNRLLSAFRASQTTKLILVMKLRHAPLTLQFVHFRKCFSFPEGALSLPNEPESALRPWEIVCYVPSVWCVDSIAFLFFGYFWGQFLCKEDTLSGWVRRNTLCLFSNVGGKWSRGGQKARSAVTWFQICLFFA